MPLKRYAVLLLKILFSIWSLYWVSTKVDWQYIAQLAVKVKVLWLILAMAMYSLSRWIAAYRLHLFFSQVGLYLPHLLNIQLYYMGMFYNLCLPGGISGDGYKIYWLQKHYDVHAKDLLMATLADRLSGLVALLWIMFLLLANITTSMGSLVSKLSWWGVAITWPLAYSVQYLFSKRFLSIFFSSNLQALLMQFTQVLTVLWLLYAINVVDNISSYLSVFLLSSLVSVLPISVGGVGAREFTFVALQPYFGYDLSTGVALSTLFFLTNVLASIPGVFCLWLRPEVDADKKQILV